MKRPRMTRAIAYAIATDAGDRSMRAAGRTAWNDEDFEFERLWPLALEED
jgi:hypothetical protein